MPAARPLRDDAASPLREDGQLRREAEELLDSLDDSSACSTMPDEIATIAHELRVHQIELEMQNEELRRAHFELDAQREKYFDLYDVAPVGYVTLDDKGVVVGANLTAALLLGVERQLLVGQPLSAFVHAVDRDDYYLRLRALIKTAQSQSIETRLCRVGKRRGGDGHGCFWALLEAQLRPADDGPPNVWIAFTDVSEHKLAQIALAARASIVERAQGGSLDETIQYALDKIEAVTGSSVGFFHFVDEDQRSLRLQTWSTNTLATQCTAKGKGSHYPVEDAGVWADCLRQGCAIIHNDYPSLANRKGMPEGHAKLVRELTVPIMRDGKVRVILGVGNKPTDYDDADLELATSLADLTLELVLAKRADEALRESQAKLLTLFELLPVGVAALDAAGVPVYSNPALERVLGISAEELRRGDHLKRTYIRADGTPMPPEEFASSIAARERRAVRDVETGVVKQDGSVVWVSVNASPIESSDWRSIVVTADITERKQARDALQTSEANYASLVEQSDDGIVVADRDGTILIWNPAVVALTGIPDEEAIGRPVWEIHERMTPAEKWNADLAQQLRSGFAGFAESATTARPQPIEREIVRTDGASRLVLDLSFPIRTDTSVRFCSVLRDITERKHAEESLRESEAKLNLAQRFAQVGSWTWDVKTGQLAWSDEMFRLFGIDPETFSGSLDDVVATAIHPDDRAAVERANLAVIDEGKPAPLEYRVIWPDGSVHVLFAEAGEQVTDEAGNAAVLLGTAQDVTDRKQRETYGEMEREILELLNTPDEEGDLIRRLLGALRSGTGFDAAGIRVRDGVDYPYVAVDGFSEEFLLTENTLIGHDEDGDVLRDPDGRPVLECTCGLVVTGEPRSESPTLTPGGSFWTNDSEPFTKLEVGEDPRVRPRNTCMSYGYSTMAIVPIRTQDDTFGLLHLNAHQKGRLTLELVERLEGIAAHIGEALARKQSVQSLRESEARLREAVGQLAASYTSSIELLGQVVEARDPYTAGHERRVAELSVAIARELGIPAEQIEDIRIAALVHDVGKISVPAEILSKPGKLSQMEFELIKGHSEAGFRVLSSAHFEQSIAEIVYQHHERSDGSGYPRGLAGDEMLDAAKVILVADVVEAMSSHRPYRAALGIDKALAEIERGAGQQYDAAVAEACATVFASGFEFSHSELGGPRTHPQAPHAGLGTTGAKT